MSNPLQSTTLSAHSPDTRFRILGISKHRRVAEKKKDDRFERYGRKIENHSMSSHRLGILLPRVTLLNKEKIFFSILTLIAKSSHVPNHKPQWLKLTANNGEKMWLLERYDNDKSINMFAWMLSYEVTVRDLFVHLNLCKTSS